MKAACCSECIELELEQPCDPCRHSGSLANQETDDYRWFDIWLGTTWVGSVRMTPRVAEIMGAQLRKDSSKPWGMTER